MDGLNPQMAPLPWLLLMFFIMMLLMIAFHMFHTSELNIPSTSIKLTKINKTWLW